MNSLENGRGRSIGWAVRRLPEEESSGGAAHVHEWIVYEEERSCVLCCWDLGSHALNLSLTFFLGCLLIIIVILSVDDCYLRPTLKCSCCADFLDFWLPNPKIRRRTTLVMITGMGMLPIQKSLRSLNPGCLSINCCRPEKKGRVWVALKFFS